MYIFEFLKDQKYQVRFSWELSAITELQTPTKL
jgi:hypothetical protein